MQESMLTGCRAKLLVIDDDPVSLRLTTEIARDTGFASVLTCSEGMRGVDLYRDERPDAVVLDLIMPETSGLEVLRLPRHEAAGAVLPTIVVTGVGDAEA